MVSRLRSGSKGNNAAPLLESIAPRHDLEDIVHPAEWVSDASVKGSLQRIGESESGPQIAYD